MGKITAYCREGCYYSELTKSKLNTLDKLINNSQYKNLEINIISIKNNEYDKNKVKLDLYPIIGNYSTFPIIIYETTKKEEFFIGGNSDLDEVLLRIESYDVSKYNIKELSLYLTSELIPNTGRRHFIYHLLILKNKIKL